MQQHNFLGPRPLGPWERAKGQISNKSQFLSQFHIFLNQTLCVFSQIKDIKHIRRYFHWVPWVMPKGLGLGVLGGQKFNFLNMVMWHIKLKGKNRSPGYTENFLPYNQTGDLGMGSKGQLPLDFFESVGIWGDTPSNVF